MALFSSVVWNFCGYFFFFFFPMDKEKNTPLIGEMLSVKKKRFLLHRQQSILCYVADTKHFGEKWKSVFHKSHRLLYIVIYTHVEK